MIFLTGLKDIRHVLEGLETGGVDYAVKPVIIEELIARIRIHISNAKVAFGARVAPDVTGRHLLATDSQGNPLWRTPQAAALLTSLFGPIEGFRTDLPSDLIVSLRHALAARNAGGSFSIGRGVTDIAVSLLSEVGADEILFRPSEPVTSKSEETRLLDTFGLTERKAEVLVWLARGKSNHDMTEILGISPRTAHKHLERILSKLGVENRSSATSVARRAIGRASSES